MMRPKRYVPNDVPCSTDGHRQMNDRAPGDLLKGAGLILSRIILAAVLLQSTPLLIEAAAAQSVAGDTSTVAERSAFSAGLYAGELFKSGLPNLLWEPQDIEFSPSYLVAANFDYVFHHFDGLPLYFEGELDVAKRYAGANQFEVDVAPFVRWTSFPWNKTLYTNVRAGALGLSYVTGISDWERQNSGNDKGSRLLQFLVTEITFASSENSHSEFFIRIHHRSGVYGLFDGVSGGSNYLAVGFRFFR
jgi:hypothetical protein